jgi:ribosome biogenesis protein YTM1
MLIVFDLQQGPSDKAALCIDQMAQSGTLATGHMDRTVCMWDTREGMTMRCILPPILILTFAPFPP